MPAFKYERSGGSFKAWLLNMTRWRISDQLRKRARQTGYRPPDDAADDTRLMANLPDNVSQSLDALWDAEWGENLLDAAMAKVKRRLDPQKYQVFDFFVNKGWPAKKVAKTFGIPVGQVYLAKHRVTGLIAEEVKKLEMETD
jgi:RNA polymerase sigma-70 factor (ECF subfamily)